MGASLGGLETAAKVNWSGAIGIAAATQPCRWFDASYTGSARSVCELP